MANHPQAEKRNRQRIKIQSHHRHFRSMMRTKIKQVHEALAEKDPERAKEAWKQAIPMIDRCAQKGVIARKKASRTIARLTKSLIGL